MALRVLLADESTTIKKVMQLALQDFAVEVKSVQAGIDVLDVARSFQPDLIFVDVLLQKKNGYEVCAALKNDAELRSTPVILMWSQFMDLDETLARSCGADSRLEKPFDVETLRKQVLELVPKTRSQRLAHFLEFSPTLNQELSNDPSAKAPAVQPAAPVAPARPAQTQQAPTAARGPAYTPPAAQAPAAPPPAPKAPAPPPIPQARAPQIPPAAPARAAQPPPAPRVDVSDIPLPSAAASSNWTMAAFDDPMSYEGNPEEEESFTPLELAQAERDEPIQLETEPEENAGEDDGWSRHDLSQFKLDLPPISVGDGREGFNIDMGEEEFSRSNIDFSAESAPQPPRTRMRRPSDTASTPAPAPAEVDYGNDLTLEAQQINDADDEIALPLEPLDLETEEILEIAPIGGEPSSRSSIQMPGNANQMSADQLERVIRAQSREIIEQVVRKIVPDLATTIIREELERLLEDTAVRESRSKDGRNL